MNVVIIEDEKPAARRLQRILEAQNIQVVTLLHTVEESVLWFQENQQPDIIFLDIQLSDGLSFEIFDIVLVKSPIIFTTAYDEYALKAFKLNSIDYLLKPIDEEELRAAITKYKMLLPEKKEFSKHLEDIKKLLVNPDKVYKSRFTITVGQHIKMIPTDTVECIYSHHKSTYLATLEGRNYLLDGTLDAIEPELSPKYFFRVNRKFLVNINAIKDIINYTNSRLQLQLKTFKEEQIIVARERVKDFKQWLG